MTRGVAKADQGQGARITAAQAVRLSGVWARKSLTLVLALMLAACAATPKPTPTAAIDPRNGDGLGGTGISNQMVADNRNGDGLGGTGIIGTISGFGSILVNGLKLEFDRATAVVTDGRPAALDELRIGQVIQGVAKKRADGQLYLETLDIQHAVSGPITAIDYKTQSMTVLGQNIRLNLAGDKAATEAFRTLRAGDVVSVSGLRLEDGTIIASRVDEQSHDGRMLVRGTADDANAAQIRIGALLVPLTSDATTLSAPKAGERVFVSGRMINGAFVPDVISGGGGLPFTGQVGEVSLEGYAPRSRQVNGEVKLHGATIDAEALPGTISPDDRIVVTGQITAPNHVKATAISKIRTVVTIMKANGSRRPSATRPDTSRPERVVPERPQIERPDNVRPDRPGVERPGAITGV